jgi:hypothetical protein
MRKINFFPENIGNLSIDETSLSNELYTILTNKAAKGKKGSIVAMIAGTKAGQLLLLSNKFRLKNEIRLPRSP